STAPYFSLSALLIPTFTGNQERKSPPDWGYSPHSRGMSSSVVHCSKLLTMARLPPMLSITCDSAGIPIPDVSKVLCCPVLGTLEIFNMTEALVSAKLMTTVDAGSAYFTILVDN